MATWFDYVSLALTLAVLAGIGFAVYSVRRAMSGAVDATKDSLKNKGLNVSKHGLSVKTDKRFDREQYLDATQRGFIKAYNASSGGNQALKATPSSDSEQGSGKKHKIWRRRETVEK